MKKICRTCGIYCLKVVRIEKDETPEGNSYNRYYAEDYCYGGCAFIKINWHDKTEITRPIKEATEQDIGKLCMFSYPQEDVSKVIGILRKIKKTTDGKNCYKMYGSKLWYIKCRRLTKQEIEKIC